MSDFQAIADRVEIEALRGEFTDAAMMRDRARLASLFTHDGALRMPNIPVELVGREEIRAGGERLQAAVGLLRADHAPGHDPAGRRHRDRPGLHPRARPHPRRPPGAELRHLPRPLPAHRDGWKFTERVYEVRYLDTTPLAGSAPSTALTPAATVTTSRPAQEAP